MEGQGLFCLVCKKHDASSKANKTSKFASEPCVRFKNDALTGHLESKTHAEIVSVDLTQQKSEYHKDVEERRSSRNRTVEAVVRNAYFLMKEEISNRKLKALNQLTDQQGVREVSFFSHDSARTEQEIFRAVGEAALHTFLPDAKEAGSYGLLVDDLTDISVKEQMICFIQYRDPEGNTETKFLFVTDLLKNSVSADAETIFGAIVDGIKNLGLDPDKFSSICTDGAAVMVGEKTGLAGRLRKKFPKILTFHCICHRLALATVDTLGGDVKYISDAHDWLRQLWQLLENSPKKMATFIKVQLRLQETQLENEGTATTEAERLKKEKERTTIIKLKKACKTRWLSFDASVRSIKKCFLAAMLALKEINAPQALGLFQKMHNAKFIGTIFMLSEVLPVLTQLSKTFQKGEVSFGSIRGSIEYAKDSLTRLLEEEDSFLKELKGGNMLDLLDLKITEGTERTLLSLKRKYIRSLVSNIEARFSKHQDVFTAFKIFNPDTLPR